LIGTFGGPNASGMTFTVSRVTFQVGDLINAVISFLLIVVVVYFLVVLPVNKLMDRYQPQPAPTKD
jgi:large conductance mechanosensitive channel